MKQASLALTMAFFFTGSFAQGLGTFGADSTKVRDVSRSLVYLKVMATECNMSQNEKAALNLFAKVSISTVFRNAQVTKADVDAGALAGRLVAATDLKKGPKPVVCDNARKTLQQLGEKLSETRIPE